MKTSDNKSPHSARFMDASAEKAWIREAHSEVKDLFHHRAQIYWLDLLATSLIAWTFAGLYFTATIGSALSFVSLFVAVARI